jgi:hypothetical protein
MQNKFAYMVAWEQTQTYYFFVVRNKEIVAVHQVKKRNLIGPKLDQFWGLSVITWYSPFYHFQFYIPYQNLSIIPESISTNHKRLSLTEFLKKINSDTS